MHTKIYKIDKNGADSSVLALAADIIRKGGLVAFPTETVYGLGANGLDEQAVAGIFTAKGRPADNPLILHISDARDLTVLATEVPANAQAIIDKYWPGPLTVVLKRTKSVPDIVTGGLDSVAIRLPDSVIARKLISLAGVPVAAPSANVSGRPSPTSAQAVLADLDGKIEAVIDAGQCDIGVESTVVDCTTAIPTLLRPGGITLEMLIDVLGEVEIDAALDGREDLIPRSPGMKYRHYAPRAPLVLLEGHPKAIELYLEHELRAALKSGQAVGALVAEETKALIPVGTVVRSYGSRQDMKQVAANLYDALRSFDQTGVAVIYAEGLAEQGLGLAVMNRLRKASGYKIIKVSL